MRGKTATFDEAISCQSPEIATLLLVAVLLHGSIFLLSSRDLFTGSS
ncbi:hypothetical protein [Rickettsia asembonensis]|nr:hypothetical protein [Rickettsia asembonensis]